MKIEARGTKVEVGIKAKIPLLGKLYEFEWECGREDFAELLAENLRSVIWGRLKKIEADAYNKGWRNAKGHRTKQREFLPDMVGL